MVSVGVIILVVHSPIGGRFFFLIYTAITAGSSISRRGGALVLDNFLKYIVEDCLRVVWVVYVLTYS